MARRRVRRVGENEEKRNATKRNKTTQVERGKGKSIEASDVQRVSLALLKPASQSASPCSQSSLYGRAGSESLLGQDTQPAIFSNFIKRYIKTCLRAYVRARASTVSREGAVIFAKITASSLTITYGVAAPFYT